jgi:transaldolase
MNLETLHVKIFADGADMNSILQLYRKPYISGFTTNPTLMRKAGIVDYETFGRELLARIPDRPVSLEVFADDFDEMEEQAHIISSWGRNVYVKIPITNTRGVSSCALIRRLSRAGIAVNATALLTLRQVREVAKAVDPEVPSIVSVFAGRIADTGIDPVPLMKKALAILKDRPRTELLWASPREILNVIQADRIGCHIITITNDVMNKLHLLGKDLDDYSLETVRMFYRDAVAAGYHISVPEIARSAASKRK